MSSKKAEMGIGTLIIFIALLLVAAVAAGVLIQTNSALQEKALITGKQAENQISNHISVVEVTARDGSDGTIEVFSQIVKLAPGSGPIKLGETILSFDTFNTTSTLSYRGISGIVHLNATDGYYTNASSEKGFFVGEYLHQGPNYINGNLQQGDVVRITYIAPRNVTENEHIRMSIIPKIGVPTTTEFMAPEVISTVREQLYP